MLSASTDALATPSDLQTVTGLHLEHPSLATIRRELTVLARSTLGSSIILSCGSHSMRIKYRPGAGFDVLTYRTDYAIEAMYTAPARLRLRVEARGEEPQLECNLLLECISTFFAQARSAA